MSYFDASPGLYVDPGPSNDNLGAQHEVISMTTFNTSADDHADTSLDENKINAPPTPCPGRREAARLRLLQNRWKDSTSLLPPQLTRRQISMISIGGVIGTGLFLGTADALSNGGPLGILLGYSIFGTVVYCLVVSIGEMVAFLPNVGGLVGLADLYVDPALGFAMGWNAWYNWTIILPAELSAASILMDLYVPSTRINNALWTSLFLLSAIAINCLGARWYGEAEFWFATFKVFTILSLLLIGLCIDLGAGAEGVIGFRYWKSPGPFAQYLGIGGPKGRFLGFWAVLMQAAFSFFGSEVPGIAAGEVIAPRKNIPHAVKRIWIRITLFYVLSVFVAGLLVPHDDPRLTLSDNMGTSARSPMVIAIQNAGWKVLPQILNAAFISCAWSASSSDVYISSRFLFFLARRGHAPEFFGRLFTSAPPPPTQATEEGAGEELLNGNGNGRKRRRPSPNAIVVPWVGVLVAAIFGGLAFLSAENAGRAFGWLSSMTSAAALQSWIACLFTYIRFYQGTTYAEQNRRFPQDMGEVKWIKDHRHKYQPYLAWYAFGMCILILVFNGWSVFTEGNWLIAYEPENMASSEAMNATHPARIPTFITSYIPIPIFLLLVFGYKLLRQTTMVKVADMRFTRGDLAEEDDEDDELPKKGWKRFWNWII